MNGKIFLEDCEITQQRPEISYDFCITSPPDFEEIGYDPRDIGNYVSFLKSKFRHIQPKNGHITVLISDRKHDGSIIQKHVILSEMMKDLGWNLVTQKIWVRSYKKNLYRLNYTFILTFRRKDTKNKLNPIIPDVFYSEHKSVGSYHDNFNLDVVKQLIVAYSKENEVVYDPFMGSGTTALACIGADRKYIGSEIVPEVHKLCEDVLKGYNSLWSQSQQPTQELLMIGG